ncbi:Retrovirus-related Pol polyprotein from transposon opus [Melia azedarach]|uniref:Retrovirus-related Pol polyprotein from transposon opus n=1 Tax=Melia azedarach TaxID=155640 RepID=A0ACC1YKU0_MELAZ|nr:Retrovirus-related Pol polyprotein from transposon opus [Melia azedarach]
MPNSEAPRGSRREVTRDPGQSSRPPPAPPQDEYAESQNVRALDPGPSRKGKEKAATNRDVEAEKAKEVRELAETRSQFQHVIKYLCDNLGIPPPPSRNLASRLGSQLRSNPAHVEPSTPSGQDAQMRLSQLRANVHDQPRSHRSDHRSTASNRPEGARSQLEGLVQGDLRYSLMARPQGEGNDPEPPYVECLRKQLLTMQEEMRELRSSKEEPSSPDILGDFTAPLADSVKNATLPGRFKMPQLDSYHGQSDPVAHVKIFQNLMLMQGVPDEIMCKVFPTTLSGPARTWYKKLSARSVKDFTTFASKFVLHFQGAKPPTKDPSSLQYIKQMGQEPLHEYVKRYHDEVMQMGVYEESETLRYFWYNLHTGPLWVSFEERPPTSYREAHDRAMKQIAIEEKRNLKREREKAEDFSDKGKDKKKQDVRPSRPVPPQQGSVPHQQDSQRAPLPYRRPPQPRPETLRPQPPPQPREVPHPPRRKSATTHAYHPLNTTREQVFYPIRNKGLLTRPPKLITPLGKRNLKRWSGRREKAQEGTKVSQDPR